MQCTNVLAEYYNLVKSRFPIKILKIIFLIYTSHIYKLSISRIFRDSLLNNLLNIFHFKTQARWVVCFSVHLQIGLTSFGVYRPFEILAEFRYECYQPMSCQGWYPRGVFLSRT